MIEKLKTGSPLTQRFGRGDAAGEVLLFTAQAHRQGSIKKANALTERTLSLAESKKTAVKSGIALIATQIYKDAYQAAMESGSITDYSKSALQVVETFGNSWKPSKSVREILSAIEKQPELPPEVAPLNSLPLTDSHREIIAMINSFGKDIDLGPVANQSNFWLLWTEEQFEPAKHYGERIDPRILEILKRGKEAIPALISLLPDRHYLMIKTPSQNAGVFFSGSGEKLESNLPKPLTRGEVAEVARFILTGIAPGSDSSDLAPPDLVGPYISFYREIKDLDKLQLARLLLDSQDNSNQSTLAKSYLTKHGTAEDFAKVEKSLRDQLLEGDWPNYGELTNYVNSRGTEAATFIGQIEKDVEQLLEKLKQSKEKDSNQEYIVSQHKAGVKQLKGLISNETADDILQQVIDGKEELDSVSRLLVTKMLKETPEERMRIILKALTELKENDARNSMARYLHYLTTENLKDAEKLPEISKFADQYRALLNEESDSPQSPGTTVARFIESAYAEDSGTETHSFHQSAGQFAVPLIKERALQRIAGKKISPYPSKDSVTESRVKELEKDIIGLQNDPEALRNYLKQLPLDEALAVVGEPTLSPPQNQAFFTRSSTLAAQAPDLLFHPDPNDQFVRQIRGVLSPNLSIGKGKNHLTSSFNGASPFS